MKDKAQLMRRFKSAFWVTALAAIIPGSAISAPPSFMGLGDLPDGIVASHALDISEDGLVVVGDGRSASGLEASRWTNGGGMVGLGDLPGGGFQSQAASASADGSVVVGVGQSAASSPDLEAFRWTNGGGMIGLGDLPGGRFFSAASGVSGDGSIVVGYSAYSDNDEAFRWTSGGGMVGLGHLPGGVSTSRAFAISADGLVVVGAGTSASGLEAFRWTGESGMVGLGDLPGGSFSSEATGVSADGLVVVGASPSASGLEAFRWTSESGMVGLGDLPGGSFTSNAAAVSADGSIVVGWGRSGSGIEVFIWDQANGMRELDEVLTALGLDLTGWALTRARGISADGTTIVGWGTNPDGNTEAWMATIPAPPPYSTTVPTGKLVVILNVTDGVTTTATQLLLGGVEGAAFGEVIGVLSPVLELSELTFEVFEGGTVMDLLGGSEIPVTLTIDPGTSWEYEELNPSSSTVDPVSDLEIDTGSTTTFALSGEVELLGELIPFSFTRADVILSGATTQIVDTGNRLPYAEAPSSALSEFWLVSVNAVDLMTAGELIANDFAGVQGLSLTLRASLSFGAPEIHYVPEPSSLAGLASGVALLMLLALAKMRGVGLGRWTGAHGGIE